jgi:type II secretory pathway pseudopilin PulG
VLHTIAAKPRPTGRIRRTAIGLGAIVVIVPVVVIAFSVAVWNVVGQSSKAKGKATQASMATYASAINAHIANTASAPPTLASLVTAGYFTTISPDAWGRPFGYSPVGSSGKPFSLTSAGPDGAFGTQDDIDLWQINWE